MKGPGGIVEELVHQFSDPFAFYRELIQNSIDAGSTRVEVTLTYRPSTKGGLLLASVADWGEGMNRDVIENYLVTKFRSTKENDLTKIGKFGIGFVSIFSCGPDAVTVDTGRDGEFWRVLFRADTTWELLKLSEPLEGTRVTLHKHLEPSEYPEFVRRSRESLSKWCKHSEVDITFSAGGVDGSEPPTPEPVKEPLTVQAPFQVEHVEEGTHIIAGPALTEPAVTGMYNRGLTLLETTETLIPGVTMKIVSRYLEHTLTRDDVRRDKHFARAMTLAKELVEQKLLPQLPAELKAAAEKRGTEHHFHPLFTFAKARLKPKQLHHRLCGGGAVSHDALAESLRTHGFLVAAENRSQLVERLLDAGWPVLELAEDHAYVREVAPLFKSPRVVLADEHFTYAAPPERPTPTPFADALVTLLSDAGSRVKRVEVSHVRGATAGEPFVLLEKLGRCVTKDDAAASPFDREAPPLLCVNLAHPAVEKAAPLFASAPRLAAVLLARLVLVREGKLTASRDEALTRWALA